MTFDSILKKIDSYACNLVEITGGEPLLQPNASELISELISKNYKVLLETNGSLSIKNIHPNCVKIIDVKCPSSKESHNHFKDNLKFLTDQDEIKFVIGTKEDYEFAKAYISDKIFTVNSDKIHFSPVFDVLAPEKLATWILNDKLNVRLSLQQHKIIWGKDKRGV